MTLNVLIKCLKDLKKRHPELSDEQVKVYHWRGHRTNLYNEVASVNYIINDIKCVIEVNEKDSGTP